MVGITKYMNHELNSYVDQMRSQGFSDEAIRKSLIEAGWDLFVINSLLQPASVGGLGISAIPAPPNAKNRSGIWVVWVIGIIIISLIIISAIGLFVLLGFRLITTASLRNEFEIDSLPTISTTLPTLVPFSTTTPVPITLPSNTPKPTNNSVSNPTPTFTPTPKPLPTEIKTKLTNNTEKVIEDGVLAKIISASDNGSTVATSIWFKNNSTDSKSIALIRVVMKSTMYGTANEESYFKVDLGAGESRTFSMTFEFIQLPPFRIGYTTEAGAWVELGTYNP